MEYLICGWYLLAKDRYSCTVTTWGNKQRKFKAPIQQKGSAEVNKGWACSWAIYLQISPSDICFKAQRDQAKFLPQLGALEAGFSETPLWVTHNAHTLFPCHVFGTPPSLLDTGSETRKNNPLNPVLVVAGSHWPGTIPPIFPRHWYRRSLREMLNQTE